MKCIICQDTKQIFIKSPTFLNNIESCPICNDFSLKELDRLIIAHRFTESKIKSIRMNQLFLDEISRLIPMEKTSESYPNNILLGIVITIDNNIPKWEIEYENNSDNS